MTRKAAEAHFHLAVGKRPDLDYYKNSGIGPFVPAAMTALAILTLDAFQFASDDLHGHYRSLQHLFQNEFSSGGEEAVDTRVRKTLKGFMADAILVPHPPPSGHLQSDLGRVPQAEMFRRLSGDLS